jgi:hypothetical protein
MNQEVKQNRAEDHSIFAISTRIKLYGADMSVFDNDTAISSDTQYNVSNRGFFSLIFELKACKYVGGVMSAPVVPLSQQVALFYSVQPSFICYYCQDYSYRVIPANYAAVVWSGTRETRIMTEEEFQVLFSSVSPCQPSGELNKTKTVPTDFIFFSTGKVDQRWNMMDGFAAVAKNIRFYNSKNDNIKTAAEHLKTLMPEEIYQAHVDLWMSYKVRALAIP